MRLEIKAGCLWISNLTETIKALLMQPQGQQMMVTAAGPAGTQMSLQTPTGIMTVAVPPGIASGQQFAVMMQMPAQPVMAQPVEMQPQMMVVKQPNTAC